MNESVSLPSVQLTEHLYQKASRALLPISGTFELSPVCNFACEMCYVRKTAQEVRAHSRPILTLEDWRRLAREAREEGLLYLLLTGGEPFLWPHFKTLYAELAQMGFLLSVNTNGSLIDREAVALLCHHPPKRINITLYGASDETYQALCGVKGVFGAVDRAIRSLQDAGVLVKLNCSLTPRNGSDLYKMMDYADRRGLQIDATSYMFPPIRRDAHMTGVNDCRFTPREAARYRLEVYRLQSTPEQYRRLLEDILRGYAEPPGLDEGCVDPLDGKIRCRAGKASFWVTWDGYLTPCGLMPQPRIDLTGRAFPSAWSELTAACGALQLSGVCEKCPNVHVCHPCAAMAIAETGQFTGIPQYLCHTVQEMRRIALEELNK